MTEFNQQRPRVLLLGGTTEASELAQRLSGDERFDAILSLAGRTAYPAQAPVPVRVGGFGGAAGLAAYLQANGIGAVIDATHPFAAQISSNAVAACRQTGTTLIALERPAWTQQAGDTWLHFARVEEAVAALPVEPTRIFSGLGRLSLDALGAAPQHHWLIRVIDPIAPPPGLPHATIVTGRGPFAADGDAALFESHGIAMVLAKNAGGTASYAKIEAARRLRLPVYMIGRPAIAHRTVCRGVDEAMSQLHAHHAGLSARGV